MIGFFSGDAEAEADLEVQVLPPGAGEGSPPVFEGHAEGAGQTPNIQLCSGENAKGALEGALSEAIWRLFANQRFINALLTARAPPPPPEPPPPLPLPQS